MGAFCIDGTNIRASKSAAGALKKEPEDHALGRSQGAFGTKLHVVTDSHGFLKTRPKALAVDKGYSFPVLRRWLSQHGIKAVIPLKSNQKGRRGRPYKLPKEIYKQRNCVERLIGWLKEFRRISTRYEKLARRFASMIRLAFIRRLWPLLE